MTRVTGVKENKATPRGSWVGTSARLDEPRSNLHDVTPKTSASASESRDDRGKLEGGFPPRLFNAINKD